MYIHRDLEEKVKPFLKRKEIIAIIGPRQAGKTTFLQYLQKNLEDKKKKVKFITFENRQDLSLFQDDIDHFKTLFSAYDYVIIDEFQYAKVGGQKLKYLFDTTTIKFIISGSSSLELTYETGKYMVGRMLTFILRPFSFREFLSSQSPDLYRLLEKNISSENILTFNLKNGLGESINQQLLGFLDKYMLYGGYPAVILSKTETEKQKILTSIVDNYLLKDIKGLLHLATDDNLLDLTKLLATQIGRLINYQELSISSRLKYHELRKHLTILEKTFIINLIKPFFTNRRTELTKNPKVYFFDTGLRNYLLSDFRSGQLRSDAGALLENHAFNLLGALELGSKLKFWRTKSKAEVDFVIETHQELYPVEIKSGGKDTIGKSLYSFIGKFKPKTALVLTRDWLWQKKIGQTIVKFIPISYF